MVKGLLSDEKSDNKKKKRNKKLEFGDKNNSMFKSDIDINEGNETNGIIVELDDEEGGDTCNQKAVDKEYEVARGGPSFMDSFKTSDHSHSRM